MQIRVINPNTTLSMTAKIDAAARSIAANGTKIVTVSPEMGPVSLEGHYDEAIAVAGLLAEVTNGETAGADGYVIACFGDPGLLAAREIATGPVLGIAEAAMHVASMVATGFSVVTTLERTCVIAEQLVHNYGMTRHCKRIRAADVAVLELEAPGSKARERVLAECRLAIAEDRSGAIVLGCAGMTDLCAELSRELGVPVIDGVAVAVKMVEALVELGLRTSKKGDLAWPLPKAGGYAGRG